VPQKIGNDTTWPSRFGVIVRIHRLYSDQTLEPGSPARLEGRSAHYLGRVLRVAVGDSVVLFNGDGQDYACTVERIRKDEVELDVRSRLPAKPESPLRITVVQAISRGERMDLTLQKCTELGAAAFQTVWSERVEVRLKGEKLERRLQHWQGVVVSACEQSGRAVVPAVLAPMALDDWAALPVDETRLLLWPGADASLTAVDCPGAVSLVVGPEGGFSDAEQARLESAGVRPVRLGPRVLRTETAAPAAVAILQALRGDLA
jgi:16S rRNA (uracil1498-N3)-methyltransferase